MEGSNQGIQLRGQPLDLLSSFGCSALSFGPSLLWSLCQIPLTHCPYTSPLLHPEHPPTPE